MIIEFVYDMNLSKLNGIFRFLSLKRRFFTFPCRGVSAQLPSICYAVTASDEEEELSLLLNQLSRYVRAEDEILLLLDSSSVTSQVKAVVDSYRDKIDTLIESPLEQDFARFKNHIIAHTEKDYIFQIDADELLSPYLIENLPSYLWANADVEMFRIARINLLIDDDKPLITWHELSSVKEEDYINFPDYQYRIFKNKTQVRWIRSLHEILSGYKTYSYLPKDKALSLLHSKHASKHTSRWWNKKK